MDQRTRQAVAASLLSAADRLSGRAVSGYLVSDVVQLKDYLTMDAAGKGYEIAWRAWPLFVGWAEETQPEGIDVDGLNVDDMHDAETGIDDVPPSMMASFWDWFEEGQGRSELNDYVPPQEQPTFLYMDFKRIVKNEWLLHFSKDAGGIAASGFKYGIDDVTTLGLTTHFFNKTGPGFNFAYLADDAARYGHGRHGWSYGNHAVMFKANGVLVWHHTDQEPQVIFLGSTAKDIVLLENGNNGWTVVGRDGPVFESDDYDDKSRKTGSSRGGLKRCIGWVKTNYDQYRNKLSKAKRR